MSDAKVAFYRSIGLTGALPDMEEAFFDGNYRKVPYVLAQSGVPVCLVPNGTVATNGVVTLGTALPTTYSGGIWLRLPANAVVGGVAGLYWAVMSSTTQGQVYTNFADPASEFIPYVPSGALVAAVGSNAAYTQTTGAEVTLANVTIPAGVIGATGSLRFSRIIFTHNNTAGTKTTGVRWGGLLVLNKARTTTLMEAWGPYTVSNRGVANRQACTGTSFTSDNSSSSASGASYLTVDTSAAVTTAYIGQLAVATDFIVLEGFVMEILPA